MLLPGPDAAKCSISSEAIYSKETSNIYLKRLKKAFRIIEEIKMNPIK